MPLHLPGVTLCCVDTTDRFPWAVRAMARSMAELQFGDAFIASDEARLAALPLLEGVRPLRIEPLRSIDAYSRFMIERLPALVRTAHVLIVQWDGFVIHPDRWRDDFLQYDYIGAPWHYHEGPHRVGNGGFSLRSRRLLQALPPLPDHFDEPEDRFICQTWRPQAEALGLKFAPPGLAAEFSIDFGDLDGRPFGFHGPAHFPEVLGAAATEAYLRTLDPARQFAQRASRDVMLGIAADLERLRSRRPELDALRASLSAHLAASVEAAPLQGIEVDELDRLCRGLIRYGYAGAALALLRRAAPRFGAARTAVLRAKLALRALQRRARGTPVNA